MQDNMRNKWRNLVDEMTIEPAHLLQMIGLGISSVRFDTMFIERVCTQYLEQPDSICKNLSSYETIEKKTSEIVSMYQMYGNLINSGFPIFFALFLGAWIDRHGTKIPLLFSLLGFIISNLFCVILAIDQDLPPWVLLLAPLPSSLVGGITAFLLAILTFISRRTSTENRSFRIGVMESGWFIGYSTGVQIGSLIFDRYGYVPVFLTSAAFVAAAFVYICLRMQEDPIESTKKTNGFFHKFTDMFQISSVRQTFITCFKKREGLIRFWLLLLVSMMCIRVLAQEGTMSLAYLYTRAKFGWNDPIYSRFMLSEILMRFAGLVGMIGAVNALQWKDTGLGIFSSFGYSVAHLVFAFAQSGWMMYLGAVIQIPCVLISILIRSAISKLVEKEELGKIFSLVAIGEATVPLIASLIFNPIYSHTVQTFPGVIFLVAAVLHGIIGSKFIYLFRAMGSREAEVIEPFPPTTLKDM